MTKKEFVTIRISKSTHEKLLQLKGAYLIDNKEEISISDLIDGLLHDQLPNIKIINPKNK